MHISSTRRVLDVKNQVDALGATPDAEVVKRLSAAVRGFIHDAKAFAHKQPPSDRQCIQRLIVDLADALTLLNQAIGTIAGVGDDDPFTAFDARRKW